MLILLVDMKEQSKKHTQSSGKQHKKNGVTINQERTKFMEVHNKT
jgi:hypothetical protein